jgi:hypothetical protein
VSDPTAHRVGDLDIGLRPQIDHNEPGRPWVAHESYEGPDCSGSRRVAYGATEDEARALGERNAAAYPPPASVPYEAALGALEPAAPAPVRLHAVDPEPVAAVVELLEHAIERAKAGEIIGVAIAAATTGRCDLTSYALGEGSIATLVLANRRLEQRLLDHEEP